MPKKSLVPFFILAGGFVWYGLLAWVRRQSWFRDPKTGELASGQSLALLGAIGLLLCMIAAAVAAFRQW